MSTPTYPYSFVSGDELDATKVNENFNQLIDGIVNGDDDISIATAEVSVSLIINSDLVCDTFATDELEGYTATFPVSVFADGISVMDSIYAVSGSTVVTLDTDEVSGGTLTVSQSNNRIIFPSLACGDIIYITTTAFEDGDIISITNIDTEGAGEISSRIKNSTTTGNIICGSDTTFSLEDSLTFMYNGPSDTFDLLFAADSVQEFFS